MMGDRLSSGGHCLRVVRHLTSVSASVLFLNSSPIDLQIAPTCSKLIDSVIVIAVSINHEFKATAGLHRAIHAYYCAFTTTPSHVNCS